MEETKNCNLLAVTDLHVSYGQIQALSGISVDIGSGEVVSLIGANGAGKSTFLKTISGLMKPKRGEIRFEQRPITGWTPEKISRLGIIHVPEGRQILGKMTVMENLELGSLALKEKSSFQSRLTEALDLFPSLKDRLNQLGGTLSGGEQQMLAIGRAIMADPRLLMMDEPSLGLAPLLVSEIFKTIRKLKDRAKALLLVEQNARKAMLVSDRCYVLENGHIAMKGPSATLIRDELIVRAYLGGSGR